MIDVDDQAGRVSIGKGMVRIKSDDIDLSIGGSSHSQEIEGAIDFGSATVLKVEGVNGRFEFINSDDLELTYECRYSKENNKEDKRSFDQNVGNLTKNQKNENK